MPNICQIPFFYAFEPYPPSHQLLIDNLKLNNINNVHVFNMAMSDTTRKMNLNICNSHNGLHTLGKTPLRFRDISTIEVECTTLDDMFYHKSIKVDFIKMDTEGYEYYILKGGINTIRTYKPIIQLEWSMINQQQCNTTPDLLLGLFDELNYQKISFVSEDMIIAPRS